MPVAKFQFPDGRIGRFEVPEGTTPEQAQTLISEAMQQQTQQEPSFVDKAIGIAEPAAAFLSGIAAETVSGISGIHAAMDPRLDPGAGGETTELVREALTFNPRTEEGKKNLESIADNEVVKAITGALEKAETSLGEIGFDLKGPIGGAIGEAIPTAIIEALGLAGVKAGLKGVKAVRPVVSETKDIATAIFKKQSPTKQRIAKLIQEGSTDVETARFKLDQPTAAIHPGDSKLLDGPSVSGPAKKITESLNLGGPRVKTDTLAVEAIKQGFDEGVIAAVKGTGRADKSKMLEMVNIMERGKKNARFAVENRPGDVAGDSLMERFRLVRDTNINAGKELDGVAKSLEGKPVDLSEAVNSFASSLDDLGVNLIDDGKGGFKPDFELSQLAPGDRGPLREVVRQMNIRGAGGVDALSAHKMKRVIDNNVTFGRSKTGISGDAERALKDFRNKLDTSLDNAFPEYNRVNTTYSETIGAMDLIQDVAGKKMNLVGPNADKATGTLLRRLMSNAQSRIRLLDAVNELEGVAVKHGGVFSDDLLSQVLFVDELDSIHFIWVPLNFFEQAVFDIMVYSSEF